MRSAIRLPLSAEVCERLRISLAMTAKPRPLSPACAASMAALMAKMLVWAAIGPTSLVMSRSSRVASARLLTLFTSVALPSRMRDIVETSGRNCRSHSVSRLIVAAWAEPPRLPTKPAASNC